MSALTRSLAVIGRRATRVATPSIIRPVVAVRCLAAPPKKPAGKVNAPVPVQQKRAPAVVEEMSEDEEFKVPSVGEAKAALVSELKAELAENSSVVADDESISKEYLQDLNGQLTTDAQSGDNILTYSTGGYTIRVRFNRAQLEEGNEEDAHFSEGEGEKGEGEEGDAPLGTLPFEIDVDNGKTVVRFMAQSQDNTCIIETMGFPDLAKEARARAAEFDGKQASPVDADFMADVVQLEHMTDNAHDALQMFLESIKVNDELAQFVIHHCMNSQRVGHQRVIEQLSAFVNK